MKLIILTKINLFSDPLIFESHKYNMFTTCINNSVFDKSADIFLHIIVLQLQILATDTSSSETDWNQDSTSLQY